jgi:DNA/RNA endonuclease YhcR with UshA esterase domain
VEENGGRSRYFVLAYDSETGVVLSLSGHHHDFTGAVLTLTRRTQEYRGRPEVTVRLFAASDLADLLARHAELFERLEFPEG